MTTLYENPEYTREKLDLVRYRDLYEGCHDTLTQPDYLWYIPIERKNPTNQAAKAATVAIRRDREQRTRYLNIVEIIVSLWASLIFRKQYTLDEDAEKNLEGIEDNIDGQGTSFWDFLKDQVATSLFVYGKVFVLTDSVSDTAASKGDEKQKGLRPFVELLEPLDCKDWQTETTGPRAGKFKFFRYEYCVLTERESAEQQPREVKRSDVLLHNGSTYEVIRYEEDEDDQANKQLIEGVKKEGNWKLKETIPTKLEEIPLSTIISSTWVHDVCEETLRHFNLRSVKDAIEFTQGFTRTFVKGINPSNNDQLDAFSNYTVTIIPADGDVIAVPPTSTADIKASVEEAIDNAFKVGLNKLRTLPASSKENESADSQQEDKENIYAIAESTVNQIEKLANDILVHIAEFWGDNRAPGTITMSREFTQESFTEWLAIYAAIRDELKRYPEINKEAIKKAITELNLGDEVMDKIDEILEKGPSEAAESQQTERGSILGRFLNGRVEEDKPEPDNAARA